MKINLIAISIMVLALSVFVSALIISNSLNTKEKSVPGSVEHESELVLKKQLLTKNEISEYLGITTQQFDELDETQTNFYGRGIPFLSTKKNVTP